MKLMKKIKTKKTKQKQSKEMRITNTFKYRATFIIFTWKIAIMLTFKDDGEEREKKTDNR